MTADKDALHVIVKMYFGSLLYGTATAESDTDIKGIFLPSKEQVLLGTIPKNVSYTTKMDKSCFVDRALSA